MKLFDPTSGPVQREVEVAKRPESLKGLRLASLQPVIQQELPLAQASRAHEAVMENGHHGKIVLVP